VELNTDTGRTETAEITFYVVFRT